MKICQFFEIQQFQKSDYFMTVDLGNLMIFEIVKFGKFLEFFFQFEKRKFDSKTWQILVLFVHSMFRTIRNFAKSHICALKF